MYHLLQEVITEVHETYNEYDFATVYHVIHNFCDGELSSFYLDFAKDILYIEAADHKRRRSIQTVYYDTLVALVKLITPILPHTAEEVWEYVPDKEAEYVQLTDLPTAEIVYEDDADLKKWEHFMEIRDDVLKALEEARDEKAIGKSLEAKITILPKNEETKEVLHAIPYLHQMLIVSGAEITESDANAKEYDQVYITVEPHPGDVCDRCWVVSETVGDDEEFKDICTRCANIIREHYM